MCYNLDPGSVVKIDQSSLQQIAPAAPVLGRCRTGRGGVGGGGGEGVGGKVGGTGGGGGGAERGFGGRENSYRFKQYFLF